MFLDIDEFTRYGEDRAFLTDDFEDILNQFENQIDFYKSEPTGTGRNGMSGNLRRGNVSA